MSKPASVSGAGHLAVLLAEGRFGDAEAVARAMLPDSRQHRPALAALARCAAANNDLPSALRWAGRARRIAPSDASLASLLGALLIAAGRAADAVTHLTDALDRGAGAETGVALASALLLTGATDRAIPLIGDLLRDHPIRRTPLLAGLADRLVRTGAAPGWVAVDGDRLLGTLRTDLPDHAPVSVAIDGRPHPALPPAGLASALFLARFGHPPSTGGLTAFALPLPLDQEGDHQGRWVTLDAGSRPLAGSPLLATRPGQRVEGLVGLRGSVLEGWARRSDEPSQPVAVTVRDGLGVLATVTARPTGSPPEPPNKEGAAAGAGTEESRPDGHFRIDLTDSGLSPGPLTVTAGPARTPLAGSPLRWVDWPAVARAIGMDSGSTESSDTDNGPGRSAAEAAWRRVLASGLPPIPMPVGEPPVRRGQAPPAPAIDVVIPVYRGREETLACLSAVLATTTGMPGSIIVIDDCSPEPALSTDLRALAADGRFTLLRNPRNLGFPATVNRGLALHADRDAIVLNADALVSGDWWQRLRAAAHSAADIGTATPLSNDATILSYPSDGGPAPGTAETAILDGLARTANAELRVDIPTGVGFCWYVRRACWAEVGDLSETLFARGYGEENDFCLRARQLGWRHVAAADVFVAHIGGRSFGGDKARLLARNVPLVNELHPGYDALVRRFVAADPLATARRRLDAARRTPSPLPARLLITFDLGGGVARHVEERCERLMAEGRRVLQLCPHPAAAGGPPRCRIDDPQQPALRDLVFTPASEWDALVAALRDDDVADVEIHHLLNHDPRVAELPHGLGVPYEVVVHDHSALCPRITMIDGSGRYCGGPEPARCTACVGAHGSRFGRRLSIADYRTRHAVLLANARRVVVPSEDTADRLRHHIPAAPVVVTPWDAITPPAMPRPTPRRDGTPHRVGVIGGIGAHKGFHVLLDCARDAAARDLPLSFVVIGHSEDDASLFATGRVFVTGPYREGEAAALIAAEGVGIALLPSVWPETWCYALSEAWSAGLPVVAFDLGAIAERVRRQGGGRLLPLGCPPGAVNDALLATLAGAPLSSPSFPHRTAGSSLSRFPAVHFPAAQDTHR